MWTFWAFANKKVHTIACFGQTPFPPGQKGPIPSCMYVRAFCLRPWSIYPISFWALDLLLPHVFLLNFFLGFCFRSRFTTTYFVTKEAPKRVLFAQTPLSTQIAWKLGRGKPIHLIWDKVREPKHAASPISRSENVLAYSAINMENSFSTSFSIKHCRSNESLCRGKKVVLASNLRTLFCEQTFPPHLYNKSCAGKKRPVRAECLALDESSSCNA